jgi:hypothetical protein
MNPNTTLQKIRQLVNEAIAGWPVGPTLTHEYSLAKLFRELDESCCNGCYLPEEWKHTNEILEEGKHKS